MQIEQRKLSAPVVHFSDAEEQLLLTLEHLKGERTFVDLSDQTGVPEGMLRAFMSRRSGAGMNTLSALVAWELGMLGVNPDDLLARFPEITRLVFMSMISRGQNLNCRCDLEAVAA